MAVYLVDLDPSADRLYRGVAAAVQLPVERVLSDALFRLAGELSLEALAAQKSKTAEK